LAQATDSAVIIPNLLGSEVGSDTQPRDAVPLYRGQALFPAFRVALFKRNAQRQQMIKVDVLEPGAFMWVQLTRSTPTALSSPAPCVPAPLFSCRGVATAAFYWRVQRDYEDAPPPTVVLFDPKEPLDAVRARVVEARAAAGAGGAPRIVLHASEPHHPAAATAIPAFLRTLPATPAVPATPDDLRARGSAWATDSVGLYPNYTTFGDEVRRYGQLPSLMRVARGAPAVASVVDNMRTCERVFQPPRGNRTCFQICE
jgi:hypothetical protein